MLNFFTKSPLGTLLILTSLTTMNASLLAKDYCHSSRCNRIYIGAFGGGLYSNSTSMSQMGTAFLTEGEGGPLAVNAQGDTNKTSSGFGGVQMGYEWAKYPLPIGFARATITPAAEIEGYWYSHTKTSHLFNPSDRLSEHDFLASFRMNVGVYLINAVFSLHNAAFRGISPYVGAGIGASRISIKNASSIQIAPAEIGINHFNSRPNDSSWAFAAQIKTGLRYNIYKALHIFGEYRYLFLDSSNYIFGATVYPTHPVTSPWNVKVQNIQYNAFVFGIQYDL